MNQFRQTTRHLHHRGGFSLMEVLVGISIFAIGMLALASLQGALTRSTVEAKVRTEAVNIAEQLIERQRGFAEITSVDGSFAFDNIVDNSSTITRNNVNYTVSQDVTDFYYDLASDSFYSPTVEQPAPVGAVAPDYKTVSVAVSWDNDRNFVISEGTETTAYLGGGQIGLSTSISVVSVSAASRISGESDESLYAPDIDYSPGAKPDIISLSLGDNKFKESLLPEPDVIRLDELVETRFDVITYSQTGAGAIFLRREEFITVSCDCTLQAPPGDAESGGRRPAVWAGDEYVRAQFVDKAYGVSSNNQQSQFCGVCCRDHHDGGSSADDHADTAVNLYGPFKTASEYNASGAFAGDHKHYSRAGAGALTLATSAGHSYVEACRLARQDGFFRVAQDFRREDLNVFPADFLDEQAEIDVYSDYVTGAAAAYADATYVNYELSPPCIGVPLTCVAQPPKQGEYSAALGIGELPSWTLLPLNAEPTQQLRSRGVYLDYLSYDMREVLANCDPDVNTAEDSVCKSGDVELDKTGSLNPLELIPFFDVQMTLLTRWNESPVNTPVDTKNEPLADDNAHQRGIISKITDGDSTVMSTGHRGNLGFTDSAPIDPLFNSQTTSSSIFVHAGFDPAPPDPGTWTEMTGELTETINGVKASDIDVEGQNGVLCDRTPTGFVCKVPEGLTNPRVRVFGYGKIGKDAFACMAPFALLISSQVINGTNAHIIYELAGDPPPDGFGYNVNIQDTVCTGSPIGIPLS